MARDYAALIAGLLAHAEDEANPEATRQAYRDKAESMMREYRIAEEDAIAADAGSVLPVSKVLPAFSGNGPLAHWLNSLITLVADHCEVRVDLNYGYVHPDGYRTTPTVVGYEGDVRYFEFLWTATHLMFSTRISPTWAESRSEAENVFLMRQAGIGRKEIADRAWGRGAGDEAKNRSRVQRVYLAEAKRRGEVARATGLGFNSNQYREAYAQTFFSTMYDRLWKARQAANAAGGVVVMAGRAERVLEAFYDLFPNKRPKTREVRPYVDPRAGCVRCDKAASGYCREHAYLKPRDMTKAERERHERRMYGASSQAGRVSGERAAQSVTIQRGGVVPTVSGGDTRELM